MKQFYDKLIKTRHYLHQHPELSGQEYETTAFLSRYLQDLGIKILDSGLETGLIAEIGQGEPVIALRADIDALPILEQTGLPYASQNSGVMHACGHDFHQTSLLGAAELLKAMEEDLQGTIRLIFQPAEETSQGASQVLATGLLDDVVAIIGFHNMPQLKSGQMALKPGAMMAGVEKFKVIVEGVSSHAARPDLGVDTVLTLTSLECVQGEGGVWPADPEYLQGAARLCEERGLVLIVDEVQTGVFRCGAPFSYQLAGIVPDIVSMAKGIAGGFPMGAFSAHGKVADLLGPGDHGSTFGGNPLACAVGRATMETLVAEGIGEHVIEVGAQLAERLAALPHVTEVRGRGLMRGAQLDVPMARSLVEQGLRAGLVLNCVGDSTLRFLPPLVVTAGQVDAMAERLAKLIEQLV